MSKSIRIRTTPNGGDKYVKLKIEQDFDLLEILSLKISQEDAYSNFCSNYGVIAGRVTVNDGFGIPNVKVSVFVPISEEDKENSIIREIYPYEIPSDENSNGVKYNLLPKRKQHADHTPVGTFAEKREVLDDDAFIEVYEKYYKYTTTTNTAGDFMLFGVPVGQQQLVYDLDISDIGFLSARPYELIAQGIPEERFDTKFKFKQSEDLYSLPQLLGSSLSVNVKPFWCDTLNLGREIGITRVDIPITNYDFKPTAIFTGSIYSDDEKNPLNKNCDPTSSMGQLNELITGQGTIEIIRRTQRGDIEIFQELGTDLIDDNGNWSFLMPMNLRKVITDEDGSLIPSPDGTKGVPTEADVRFRISMNVSGDEDAQMTRAKILVPNMMSNYEFDSFSGEELRSAETAGSPIFNINDELSLIPNDPTNPSPLLDDPANEYNYLENFFTFRWKKVYTIRQYIGRFQTNPIDEHRNFVGLKDVTAKSAQNKIPFNRMDTTIHPIYNIICHVVTIIGFIIAIINGILNFLNSFVTMLCQFEFPCGIQAFSNTGTYYNLKGFEVGRAEFVNGSNDYQDESSNLLVVKTQCFDAKNGDGSFCNPDIDTFLCDNNALRNCMQDPLNRLDVFYGDVGNETGIAKYCESNVSMTNDKRLRAILGHSVIVDPNNNFPDFNPSTGDVNAKCCDHLKDGYCHSSDSCKNSAGFKNGDAGQGTTGSTGCQRVAWRYDPNNFGNFGTAKEIIDDHQYPCGATNSPQCCVDCKVPEEGYVHNDGIGVSNTCSNDPTFAGVDGATCGNPCPQGFFNFLGFCIGFKTFCILSPALCQGCTNTGTTSNNVTGSELYGLGDGFFEDGVQYPCQIKSFECEDGFVEGQSNCPSNCCHGCCNLIPLIDLSCPGDDVSGVDQIPADPVAFPTPFAPSVCNDNLIYPCFNCNGIEFTGKQGRAGIREWVDCTLEKLASDLGVVKFDFYNDWINGSLYYPLIKRKLKTSKDKSKAGQVEKDKFCDFDCYNSGIFQVLEDLPPLITNPDSDSFYLNTPDNNTLFDINSPDAITNNFYYKRLFDKDHGKPIYVKMTDAENGFTQYYNMGGHGHHENFCHPTSALVERLEFLKVGSDCRQDGVNDAFEDVFGTVEDIVNAGVSVPGCANIDASSDNCVGCDSGVQSCRGFCTPYVATELGGNCKELLTEWYNFNFIKHGIIKWHKGNIYYASVIPEGDGHHPNYIKGNLMYPTNITELGSSTLCDIDEQPFLLDKLETTSYKVSEQTVNGESYINLDAYVDLGCLVATCLSPKNIVMSSQLGIELHDFRDNGSPLGFDGVSVRQCEVVFGHDTEAREFFCQRFSTYTDTQLNINYVSPSTNLLNNTYETYPDDSVPASSTATTFSSNDGINDGVPFTTGDKCRMSNNGRGLDGEGKYFYGLNSGVKQGISLKKYPDESLLLLDDDTTIPSTNDIEDYLNEGIAHGTSHTPYYFYFGLIPGRTALHKTISKFFADKVKVVGVDVENFAGSNNPGAGQTPTQSPGSILATCLNKIDQL